MSYRVIIRPKVLKDLDEIERKYDKLNPGLGIQFNNRYEETLDRIELQPLVFPKVNEDVRLVPMHQFPYNVLFLCYDDVIVILRVLHKRRSNKLWNIKRRQNGKH